jgi:predicted ATPase
MSPEGIPRATSAFLGREEELETLRALAQPGRIVTLVGPGGIGKTRLALAFLEKQSSEGRAAPAWFCDLAAARDEDGLTLGVARALGLRIETHAVPPAEQVARRLAIERAGALLLLDNLEQLPPALDATIGDWCSRAASVRFVATSRRPLGLERESVMAVEALPLPPAGETSPAVLERSVAVRLFFDRAKGRAHGDLSMERDGTLVAALVRRLEGIALAIELAAGRLDVLSLGAIEHKLDERFRLLRDPVAMGSHRHATLWATVAWSWDLLPQAHRTLLARASVFEGAFDREAAESVLVPTSAESPGVVDVLESLASQSLARKPSPSRPGEEGASRFALYETVREFAAEHLTGAERDHALTRHARFFAARTSRAAADYEARGRASDLRDLERDNDDAMAALRRTLDAAPPEPEAAERAAALVVALGPVLLYQWRSQLHLDLVGRAHASLAAACAADHGEGERLAIALGYARALVFGRLGRLDDAQRETERWLPVARARGARMLEGMLELVANNVDLIQGRVEAAGASAARAVACFAGPGAERLLGRAVLRKADADIEAGRFEEGFAETERALVHFAVNGSPEEPAARCYLGQLAFERGDLDTARDVLEEARAGLAAVGDSRNAALAYSYLGKIAQVEGRWDEAARIYEQVHATFDEMGHRRLAVHVSGDLGVLALQRGDLEEAEARLREAARVLAELGNPRFEAVCACALAGVHALRGDLPAAERALAEVEGRLRAGETALFVPIVDVYRGVVEALRGDTASARRRLDELAAIPREETRVALPLLRRTLEQAELRARAWVFEPDGAAFRAPRGGRVELDAHSPQARVLAALASHRVARPGELLAKESLVRAAWPDEQRLSTDSGANRLRVAVAKLRRAGLQALIVSGAGGYMLDPATPVQVVGMG